MAQAKKLERIQTTITPVDMLSTVLTIDSTETNSSTAATPAVNVPNEAQVA